MYKKFLLVLFASFLSLPVFAQMLLQQSTAPTVIVGPVVSAADPSTAVTSNSGWTVYGYKNGTIVDFSGHTIVHSQNGYFLFYLNTTDTNTTGRLKITFVVPSALTFWHDYLVVPADVYANNFTTTYQFSTIADYVWNEGLSAHMSGDQAGAWINGINSYSSSASTNAANAYAAVDTEIATIDANVDAILVDTGTTLEGKINTINSNTANTYAKVDTEIATIDSTVNEILADTGLTLNGKIDTIDNNVDAILADTGTTLPDSINNISTSLKQADIDLITAGNDIIPASGMTLPKFNYSRQGDDARVLIARGLSYSANQPDVLFRLVDGSGTEVTHAMEDSFTWATFAMQAPDITGATPYAHLFKWQISDSVPDGWYQMYTVVESNSRAIGTVNTIILSPTPTIDESGLVARSAFNEFVSDVSQSFRSIRQGHPAEFTAYRNSTELTRSTPSVSSVSSRHAPTGSLYGLRSRFFDPFSNEYVTTDWLYDYDETYGASGRGKAFEATVRSVSDTAVLESVTLTTSGEVD